jgi:hypothetical protein
VKRIAGLALALAASVLLLGARPAQNTCRYEVSPTWFEFDAAFHAGEIEIRTDPGCAWTADTPSGSRVGLSPSAGVGPGTVSFNIGPMQPDAAYYWPVYQSPIRIRWNTPTAGQNVWVTQTAGPCDRAFASEWPGPSSRTFGSVGGTGKLFVFAAEGFGYPWRVTQVPDWITLRFPPLGIVYGNDGAIGFDVAPNPSSSPRDGNVMLCDGRGFPVHQAGRLARQGPYVPADVDGDGAADLIVYRRTPNGIGTWYVLRSSSAFTQYQTLVGGFDDTTTVAADVDGDTRMDFVAYPYNTTWYSSSDYSVVNDPRFFSGDARPVLGDFNGDGKSDYAYWHPPTGDWVIRVSDHFAASPLPGRVQWGLPGDISVPADFDGDGTTDLSVWRPSNGTWYIRVSSENFSVATARTIQWGLPGDVPIPGDFDGDRRADLAVWRPSNGTWYVIFASANYAYWMNFTVQWGLPGDYVVANDYDGDGRLDYAVWRPSNGTWYVLPSTGQYRYENARSYQWGLPGDVPVSPWSR